MDRSSSTVGNKPALHTSTRPVTAPARTRSCTPPSLQGELAARHAAKVKKIKPVDWSLLLNVVFTDPQLATIGRLERHLDAAGTPYLVASYPFNDHGKSILMDANYGYVKVIAEPKRGRILGAEIVGKDAGELIHAFSGPLADARNRLRPPARPLVSPDSCRNHYLPTRGDRRSRKPRMKAATSLDSWIRSSSSPRFESGPPELASEWPPAPADLFSRRARRDGARRSRR